MGAALAPAAASQRFGQQQGAGGHNAVLLPPRQHSSHEVSPLLAPPGLATHPSSWHKLNETTRRRENGESVSSHTIIWLPLKAKGQRAFFPGSHSPSNRAPLLPADLFVRAPAGRNGARGAKKLAQSERGGKRGRSQRVAAKSAGASPRSLATHGPESRSRRLLFISAAACDVPASPGSGSRYFGFRNRSV